MAAYAGQIVMRTVSGRTIIEPFTATDVDTNYIVFTNSGQQFYNTPERLYITDIAVSAAGAVTKLNLRVNGLDSGNTLYQPGLVNTINNRLPSPIGIEGSRMIQFKQLA
jgi:hypothetical protein